MTNPISKEYPFGQTSYIAAFGDGIAAQSLRDLSAANAWIDQLAQKELQEIQRSWRSEGHAEDSHVRILYLRHDGDHYIQTCNDEQVQAALVTGFQRDSIQRSC